MMKKAGTLRLFLLRGGNLPRFAPEQLTLVLVFGLILLIATAWRYYSIY